MIRNRPRVFAGLQLAIEMNAEMCDESPLALLDPPTRRTFIGPRIGPSIVLPLARSSHVAVMTAIGVEEKSGAVAPTSTLSIRSAPPACWGSIPTTRLGLGIPREAGRPSWLPDARPDAKAESVCESREPEISLPEISADTRFTASDTCGYPFSPRPSVGRVTSFPLRIRTATEPPFAPRDSVAPECSW